MGWQDSPIVQPAPGGWQSSPIVGDPPMPPETRAQTVARVGAPEELSWMERNVAPVLESLGSAFTKAKPMMPAPVRAAADVVSNPAPIVQGMADPAIGITQLIAEAIGQGDKVTPAIQAQERQYQQGRGADADSFDLARTVASVVNPLPIKAATMVKPAASVMGRMGQGAAVGTAASSAAPVYDEDFWGTKGIQAVTGGLFGGAVPGAVAGAKTAATAVRNIIEPHLPGAGHVERRAGRTFNELAGDRRDAVVEALEADKRFVPGSRPTAGEAAVPAGSAEFAGAQTVLEGRKPSDYLAREREQNQARLGAVREVGKDKAALEAAKAERAANAAENYDPIRDKQIDPRAETQIMEDAIKSRTDAKNVALQDKGRFDTFAAQQENLGNDWVPIPGQPRVAARVSEFPERVAEGKSASMDAAAVRATRAKEEKFLNDTMASLKATVGLDDVPLSNFLKRPSMREAVKAAIKGASEKQSYFPKPGEKFSIDNLQRMKMALDDIVKDPASFGIKATEALEITNTRNAFVRWLGNRSTEWKAARLKYAEDSVPINQMQIGQELEKKLEPALNTVGEGAKAQRADLFSTAVREAPSTIKKATGAPRYDSLDEVLTPEQLGKIDGVAKDLARSANYDDMGKRGAEAARKVLVERLDPKNPIPPMVERATTLINAVVRRVEGVAGEKTKDRMAVLLQNPKEVARVMRMATEQERHGILATLFGAAERASLPAVAGGAAGMGASEAGDPPAAPKKSKSVPKAPRDPKERVLGAVYETPKGNMEWSENGWLTIKP